MGKIYEQVKENVKEKITVKKMKMESKRYKVCS